MQGHIVAMGGGGVLSAGSRLEDLVLELAGVRRPKVCFLATAVAEHPERILAFYQGFASRDCELTHVELFGRPEEPAQRVAGHDVVYVSGGNTANMLALWRIHGIDRAVREVWERGGVLAGWSAGALCWFEDGVTDSWGPLRALEDGLGLLAGSFCPHYDAEPLRRPVYARLLQEGMRAGYAVDDDAALVYEGAELREAVAQSPGARAYRVSAEGEEPLETRQL